jgi:hypothetical protein
MGGWFYTSNQHTERTWSHKIGFDGALELADACLQGGVSKAGEWRRI